MQRFLFTLLIVSCCGSLYAEPLKPIEDETVSQIVAFGFEPIGVDQRPPYGGSVRIWIVPETVGECGGMISTCPDFRLFFSYVTGDLYQEPVVFQLPAAKGWEFVGGSEAPDGSGAFTIRTDLPWANVDIEERRNTEYKVVVGEISAGFTAEVGDAQQNVAADN